MARKNGKTELIAALALCHLCGPEAELNGEIYSAAADKYQAAQVYKAASRMVEADAELRAQVNVIESNFRMVHYASGSFYQALSKDAKAKHGFNASVVIYDELAQAPNGELYEVLTTSMSAREEPLVLVISTVSAKKTSLMAELTDYGRKVEAGVIKDPHFRAFIFQVPMDLDPFDEKNWHLANPALGTFKSLEYMRDQANKAKRMPGREAAFRNLELNQEVSADNLAIAPALWAECQHAFDLEQLRGKACVAGLDLSGKADLTALTFEFPVDDAVLTLTKFWTPKNTIQERGDRDRVPYKLWADQDHLIAVPGSSIDYAWVAKEIGEAAALYDLRAIAFDRYRIDDLIRELNAAGIACYLSAMDDKPDDLQDGIRLIKHGQGFIDMGQAVDAMEEAMLNGQLKVLPNPVMTMCASNAIYETDAAGNRKFTKKRSTGRIDGMVSMAMASRILPLAAAAGGKSFWES